MINVTKQELFKVLEILKEECERLDYSLVTDVSNRKENFEYTNFVGKDDDLAFSLAWIMWNLPEEVVDQALRDYGNLRKAKDILNQGND